MISLWPFIGEHMFTQEIRPFTQAPNQLESRAERYTLGSPREQEGGASSSEPPLVPRFHPSGTWNTSPGDQHNAPQFVPTQMQMATPNESQPAEAEGQHENDHREQNDHREPVNSWYRPPMNDEDPDTTGTYAHMEHDEGDGTTIASLFHVQTRLADGRPSLLIDPGSVGNLSGDSWAKGIAQAAAKNGHTPSYEKRSRPLRVSGVGQGTQVCNYDCKLPVAFKQLDGRTVSMGFITTPTVQSSELPGLLGLAALRNNRAILDFQKMELYFVGPGDYDLQSCLPPGSDGFQLEVAPSGHLVLPCCEYASGTASQDHSLTLVTQEGRQSRGIPPPPRGPPVLPTIISESLVLTTPPGLQKS